MLRLVPLVLRSKLFEGGRCLVSKMDQVRLTQFSHGGGCGCKISPSSLSEILQSEIKNLAIPQLLVGNETRDDAAVFDVGNGLGIVSTTDFFMPIVDDPTEFGQIAATNAISDIYAMGGTPIMAIAILGWPVSQLPLSVARRVVEGGRLTCNRAGIPLCGGHSIDSPEPIFGLAVTGTVPTDKIKRNSSASPNCRLYLTKPLGVGVLTTAEKKGKLKNEHIGKAAEVMCQLNRIGTKLGQIEGVRAMTDVTGFGLLGHLLEMCEGSGVLCRLNFNDVPILEGVAEYIADGCCPGGTSRNYESCKSKACSPDSNQLTEFQKSVLCDPQTSGGLLIAVEIGAAESELIKELKNQEILYTNPIGILKPLEQAPKFGIYVVVE